MTDSNDIGYKAKLDKAKSFFENPQVQLAAAGVAVLLMGYMTYHLHSETKAMETAQVANAEHVNLPMNLTTVQREAPTLFAKADNTQVHTLGRLSLPSVISLDKASSVATGVTNTATSDIAQKQTVLVDNDPNAKFMNDAANQGVITTESTTHDNLEYRIFQGKEFTATLANAVNSDLPGMVTAVTTQPIYGFQGTIELLPKGTKLVGVNNSALSFGSQRIFIAWQRAIRPDGIDIQLGSPGGDALGQAGITGQIDTHFIDRFKDSALMSLLGAGVSTIGNGQNQYQSAVVNSAVNTSGQTLSMTANLRPTITVAQGTIINVMVARDLDFSKSLKSVH